MGFPVFRRNMHWSVIPAIGLGRYLWLIGALALLFLIAPWLSHIVFFHIRLSDVISVSILLAGIAAVSRSKGAFLILLLFAVLTVFAQLLDYYTVDVWPGLVATIAAMLFLLALFTVIAIDVFRSREVTAETLAGACCGYVLIAGIFAAFFSIMIQFDPNSIALWEEAGMSARELVFPESQYGLLGYYSVATLTTLGYGDIVPSSNTARSVAALEAVIGQLYLAVIVARLVGMYISGRSVGRAAADPASS